MVTRSISECARGVVLVVMRTLDQPWSLRLCQFLIHRPIGCAVHLVPGEEQPVVQDGLGENVSGGEPGRATMKVRLGLRGGMAELPHGLAVERTRAIVSFSRFHAKPWRCVSGLKTGVSASTTMCAMALQFLISMAP